VHRYAEAVGSCEMVVVNCSAGLVVEEGGHAEGVDCCR